MNDCWFIRLLDALSSEDCRLVTKLSEIWANSLFFLLQSFILYMGDRSLCMWRGVSPARLQG
jgi:hypothetical protein